MHAENFELSLIVQAVFKQNSLLGSTINTTLLQLLNSAKEEGGRRKAAEVLMQLFDVCMREAERRRQAFCYSGYWQWGLLCFTLLPHPLQWKIITTAHKNHTVDFIGLTLPLLTSSLNSPFFTDLFFCPSLCATASEESCECICPCAVQYGSLPVESD